MKQSWFFIFIGLLGACDGRPPREKFPGPSGRTTDMQQVQAQRMVMSGVAPGEGVVAQRAETHAPREESPDQQIAGRIELPSGDHPQARYLFIAARPPGGGPPLAVKKDMNPTFPYTFTLSSRDAMMAGTQLVGEVLLVVRLKQDPNPLSHSPGDYSVTRKVSVGTQGLKLHLKKE